MISAASKYLLYPSPPSPPSPSACASLSLSLSLLKKQQQQPVLYVYPCLEYSSGSRHRIHPRPNCPGNMVFLRIVACLSLLLGFSLQVDVKSGKETGKAGNFMEDEQWLSTISQYSRKIKHWNRFRDVSCVFSLILSLLLFHLTRAEMLPAEATLDDDS